MNAPESLALKPALDGLKHDLEKQLHDLGGSTANGKAVGSFDDVEVFLRGGDRMLELARRRIIELEMRFGQKRRMLVNKASDDLHRLETEHHAAVQAVQAMIARLEAMRHG